ncbi:G-D-S-L family lipolytic protein [Flavobacterium sp. LMO8]|uniref:G-D-S-L family lipolytic protein n=1 Tax=Flavobacterium sp. LMO8 TaxID=2654244 RepID=UPI00129247D6|nr:G-D-S-L family lipolytic protein [Flavobacterium sp. LMO8]MQP25376.1 G-D-S-L family lipolytic protein [Flavobacterium sp. LMO8]
MKNKFIYLAVLAAGFASCEPEFENEVDANYTSGDADFTTYVAIGNSLTAGYMDGTVSRGSQANSFPNLLAQQFTLVGGGEFTQPSFADDVDNLGGLMLGGIPIGSTRLVIDASEGRPETIVGTSTIEVSNNLQATAYNNMGVPGAKSFHLVASGYGNLAGVSLGQSNPYFVRHATSPTATILDDAMTKNPTFFTNWIGANDVLSYATNGGAQSDGETPAADHNTTGNLDPSTYGGNDITNSNVFASVYSTIINTLISGGAGAKGVVATIPSVTSIPYFTTVPYNPLSPTALGGATNINTLNAQLYGPLNQIFSAYGEPSRVKLLSATAANPILIYDADAADRSAEITGALTPTLGAPTATAFGMVFGKARQATREDLVVLPASSVIGTPNTSSPSTLININGVSYPMANKWVLTSNEKAKVANATASYNSSIRSIAAANGLAVADMNAIMNQLVGGLRIEDGTIYTANYFSSATASTVLFSLDGVHPNAKGYAVITNEIIKVINRHYNANLPFVYASSFPGATILQTN